MTCCKKCHVNKVKNLGFERFFVTKIVLVGKNSNSVKSIADMKSLQLFYDIPRKNIMTCIRILSNLFI